MLDMTNPAHVKLTEFDFIICVDASGSMTEADCPNNKSRWDYMQETLGAFVRDMDQIDSDGLGLVIFGGQEITAKNGVTSGNVAEIIATRCPVGGTPLAQALATALNFKSDKKKFIMIFTDGVPDDKEQAAKVIREQSNKQTLDDECTFLFVQIGRNKEATAYLQMLDDNLKGAKFDIVDAKTIEEAEKFASTAELVLHAIND